MHVNALKAYVFKGLLVLHNREELLIMSRRSARNHAFALVFQLGFYKELNVDEIIQNYFEQKQIGKITEEDREFIYTEFSGIYQNIETIDKIISNNLKGWTINRLNKVDLAILRLALYEIIYVDEIPKSVSVNEAIELCKEYSSDDAPGFINGVLGMIVKEL